MLSFLFLQIFLERGFNNLLISKIFLKKFGHDTEK